jgi:hypothetical protein
MIRLITTGVCALILAGCTAEQPADAGGTEQPADAGGTEQPAGAGGTEPAASSVATDTSAKFELGKGI